MEYYIEKIIEDGYDIREAIRAVVGTIQDREPNSSKLNKEQVIDLGEIAVQTTSYLMAKIVSMNLTKEQQTTAFEFVSRMMTLGVTAKVLIDKTK